MYTYTDEDLVKLYRESSFEDNKRYMYEFYIETNTKIDFSIPYNEKLKKLNEDLDKYMKNK